MLRVCDAADRQVADLVNDEERGPGTGSGSVRTADDTGFRTGKGQGTIRIFPRRFSGAARPQFCAARGPGSEDASKVCLGWGLPTAMCTPLASGSENRCFWHPSTSNWPALARRGWETQVARPRWGL